MLHDGESYINTTRGYAQIPHANTTCKAKARGESVRKSHNRRNRKETMAQNTNVPSRRKRIFFPSAVLRLS